MSLRQSEIISLAGQYGVPAELALAVYQQESGMGKYVGTGETNVGGFQVAPATFDEVYPGGDINNERDNAIAGIRYLKQGLAATGGDVAKTAMYYHAGPKFAEKLAKNPDLQDSLGKKTVSYATDIINNSATFRQKLVEGGQIDAEGTPHITLPGNIRQAPEKSLPTKPDPQAVIENLFTDLQGSLANARTELAGMSAYTDDYSKAVAALTESIASKAEQKGISDGNVERAKYAADARLASQAATTLSQAGLNTDDMISRASDTLMRMGAYKDQASALRAQLQEKNSVDFISDPISWVQAQMAIDPLIQKHNNAIANYNIEKHQLDGLVGSASAVNLVQNAKKATLLAGAAEGTARSLELQASIDADKARLVSADHNWTVRNQRMQQLDAEIRVTGSVADALLKSEDLKERMLGKEMKAKQTRDALEQYNTGLADIGVSIASLDEIKLMSPQKRKVFDYLVGEGRFGPDFQGSVESLAFGNRAKMPTTTTSVLPFAYHLAATGKEATEGVQHEGMSVAEKRAAYNSAAEKEANKWMNDLEKHTSQVENPYIAPDVKTMIKDPHIMQLKIGQLLAKTVAENPGVPLDDKRIADLVRAGFTDGTVYNNVQEAANDLVLYYKAAVTENNKAHNFYGMNIPTQDRYNFTPPNGVRTNFTNYGQVMSYLAKNAWQRITTLPTFESIVP